MAQAAPVLGAVLPFVQAKEAKKARESAERIAAEQASKQEKLEQEAKTRMLNEESEANTTAVRDSARKRQKAQAAAAGGRSSTILTSPLGITEAPQTSGKTLLGS